MSKVVQSTKLKSLYVTLYEIKTQTLDMCIDKPIVNSKRAHRESVPRRVSTAGIMFSRTVHLAIILLRHVRYNKDWGYV